MPPACYPAAPAAETLQPSLLSCLSIPLFCVSYLLFSHSANLHSLMALSFPFLFLSFSSLLIIVFIFLSSLSSLLHSFPVLFFLTSSALSFLYFCHSQPAPLLSLDGFALLNKTCGCFVRSHTAVDGGHSFSPSLSSCGLRPECVGSPPLSSPSRIAQTS